MEARIQQAITKLFERHRIVFWYDTKRELRESFQELSLPGVQKVEVQNNEYALKYHILREEPKSKFLLYHEGPQPPDLENWLLDVQLAQATFRADLSAIWLSELNLGAEFNDIVSAHEEFFQAEKRRIALKQKIKPHDTPRAIEMHMLAICAHADDRIESVLLSLLDELANDRDEKIRLVSRCSLEGFLWKQMERSFGYQPDDPNIRDFTVELFHSCYCMGTGGDTKLTSDALVFLKHWKDSKKYAQAFDYFSHECAAALDIEADLTKRDFRDLMELDYFRLIDQKIISDLVREVANRTVSAGDVSQWIWQRKSCHWYEEFGHLYEAIEYAATFLHSLTEMDLHMESLDDGIRRYTASWYRLDQLYRKCCYHCRKAGQATLLEELKSQVENQYTNTYLLRVNDAWQEQVDDVSLWKSDAVILQRKFYDTYVRPFVRKEVKVAVIISDALRYEIAEELLGLIRQEDRYGAELTAMLAMLPSYTQLGMASLLPNTDIQITDDATVMVDSSSTQGTINRAKLLERIVPSSKVMKADDLMSLHGDECRVMVKDHDVLYVYHNRIDAAGDKMETEGRTFEAAEQALEDLVKLVKKLAGANLNKLIITADHGFIYQDRAIEESDYAGIDAAGDHICHRDRRFVLGKGMKNSLSLKTFTADQLGLAGNLEVQIPKSINRLRVKGSGSRFVHGGASLQETVLPVVQINKRRQSDVTSVEVDILRGASSIISSNQLAVAFYQTTPATDKVQPRTLRAGIYTQTRELISDRHEITFDISSPEAREREVRVRFVLSQKADAVNGQEVLLKLEERHAGTSHYKEYKSLRYTMHRSFTKDFDL